jgi:hypothetical protein
LVRIVTSKPKASPASVHVHRLPISPALLIAC